jgi:hypothetical protein
MLHFCRSIHRTQTARLSALFSDLPSSLVSFPGAQRRRGQLGTVDHIAELLYCWCAPQMEDAMCYERDYKIFEDRKKAEDTRVIQERRAGLIDRLLNAANKSGEKTKAEGTPVKEVAPAK